MKGQIFLYRLQFWCVFLLQRRIGKKSPGMVGIVLGDIQNCVVMQLFAQQLFWQLLIWVERITNINMEKLLSQARHNGMSSIYIFS